MKTETILAESINQFCAKLLANLENYKARVDLRYFDAYKVNVEYLRKFARVTKAETREGKETGQESIICFINLETGDIMKPATWKSPAKHARGNIHSAQNGMEAITFGGFVKYL